MKPLLEAIDIVLELNYKSQMGIGVNKPTPKIEQPDTPNLSRRSFVKNGSILAANAILYNTLHKDENSSRSTIQKIKDHRDTFKTINKVINKSAPLEYKKKRDLLIKHVPTIYKMFKDKSVEDQLVHNDSVRKVKNDTLDKILYSNKPITRREFIKRTLVGAALGHDNISPIVKSQVSSLKRVAGMPSMSDLKKWS